MKQTGYKNLLRILLNLWFLMYCLLITLVLRLVRPALIGPLSLVCDSKDLAGDLWEKELKTDVTTVQGLENLSLGQFLRLPQGFG